MALTKVSTGMLSADAASVDLNIDAGTMFIDASANRVGIGNTSPATALDVTGTVTATGAAFESTGATQITIEDTDGGFAASKINVQNGGRDLKVTAPQDIIFNVGSSDAVTILNDGSVEIGDGTVSASLKMLSGTSDYFQIDSTSTVTNLIAGNSGSGSAEMAFYTASAGVEAERLRITSAGNVGIGTSSPNAPLEVAGAATTSTDIAHFSNSNGVQKVVIGLDGEGDGQITLIDAGNNTDVLFTAGGASYINTGGNFGIGTDSPARTLHSKGASGISTTGKFEAGGSQVYIQLASTGQADGDSGYIGYDSSKNLTLFTDNTERMRIDSGGSVLIGKTTPTDLHNTWNHLIIGEKGAIISENGAGGIDGITLADNVYVDADTGTYAYQTTAAASQITQSGGVIKFYNAASGSAGAALTPVERMRLDSSGNLLVGNTITPSSNNQGAGFINTGASGLVQWQAGTTTTSSVSVARFYNPNGNVGSIQLSGSATSYVTSSDYRLKENIVDAPPASDDIDAIQVRSFDWKADGSHQKYGMVAQELQTVAPEAVSAPEDPEEMMGVDYSKLVPMMLKEIQSLRARVAQLES